VGSMAALGIFVPTLSWTSHARIVRNPASSYFCMMVTDRFAPNPSDTKENPIVLTDISGYTTFITTTKLKHSQHVVTILLKTMIENQQGHLETNQVTNNTVVFINIKLDPTFLSWINSMYVAFHQMTRDLTKRHDYKYHTCSLMTTL